MNKSSNNFSSLGAEKDRRERVEWNRQHPPDAEVSVAAFEEGDDVITFGVWSTEEGVMLTEKRKCGYIPYELRFLDDKLVEAFANLKGFVKRQEMTTLLVLCDGEPFVTVKYKKNINPVEVLDWYAKTYAVTRSRLSWMTIGCIEME